MRTNGTEKSKLRILCTRIGWNNGSQKIQVDAIVLETPQDPPGPYQQWLKGKNFDNLLYSSGMPCSPKDDENDMTTRILVSTNFPNQKETYEKSFHLLA